jgi:hypothetical protein
VFVWRSDTKDRALFSGGVRAHRAEKDLDFRMTRTFGLHRAIRQLKVSVGWILKVVSTDGFDALERRDVNELVTLIRDCDDPRAYLRAFMQQAATELGRSLVGGPSGDDGIWQIDPFLIPDELLLRAEMEVVTGHLVPLCCSDRLTMMEYSPGPHFLRCGSTRYRERTKTIRPDSSVMTVVLLGKLWIKHHTCSQDA